MLAFDPCGLSFMWGTITAETENYPESFVSHFACLSLKVRLFQPYTWVNTELNIIIKATVVLWMNKEPPKGQALSYVFPYGSSCNNLRNCPVNISLSILQARKPSIKRAKSCHQSHTASGILGWTYAWL